jgi:hypothetical protein
MVMLTEQGTGGRTSPYCRAPDVAPAHELLKAEAIRPFPYISSGSPSAPSRALPILRAPWRVGSRTDEVYIINIMSNKMSSLATNEGGEREEMECESVRKGECEERKEE